MEKKKKKTQNKGSNLGTGIMVVLRAIGPMWQTLKPK
jgi:hypothetical protein